VSLALALTAVVAIVLLTQFIHSAGAAWVNYFTAVGNMLAFSVIFSLLLEFCRLHYKRRALGSLALWIFILCVLPFIAAGVFGESTLAEFSLLSPGCAALSPPDRNDLGNYDLIIPLGITVGHLFIAVLLLFGWLGEWNKLLARAV
jgi:hypothetical protein